MYFFARTDLGLRLLFLLASQPNRRLARPDFGRVFPWSISSIRPPLEALAASGLITSYIGNRGGYRLSRPPEEITLLQAIAALEGDFELIKLEAEGCGGLYVRTLSRAKAGFFKELEKVTLADIVRDADSMKALGITPPGVKRRDRRRV